MIDELLALVKDVQDFIEPKERVIKPAPTNHTIEKAPSTKDGSLLKMHALFKEVAPTIRICDPYPPLLFIYFNEEERLFMDKVAQALMQIKIGRQLLMGRQHQEKICREFLTSPL